MLPDRVSNPGPLTYESGALPKEWLVLSRIVMDITLITLKCVYLVENKNEINKKSNLGALE